ncbi:hypothetical protein EVJ58_g5186 [Rhodofomes roseus]|uniref:Inositol-pentakisphosphate 2-kinase n=1 Tax=Rhodofomes roseus TaxID=34475 RepID=A0A4Y9YEV7_9APHY|nr:hypothetical protein EVJ58_g5186 [Rhodofomes roseus]
MTSHVSQTATEDWRYIAEGGSTIVFSYNGPVHSSLDNKVLRLRKISISQRVILRLVPDESLPHLEVVKVEKKWLRLLADAAEANRPEVRRAEDRIDWDRETAVLADNLIGGSGLAVEIKPKWGFLPCPDYLSPTTRRIKTRTCRFCMHAYHKDAAEKHVPSDFCPLDLYSGEEHRVRVALHALWDAWMQTDGGINNLRIFASGRVLRPTTDLALLQSLLTSTESTTSHSSVDALRIEFINALLPTLMTTRILRLLSFLQRTLDPLDIEGVAALWARIHGDKDADAPLGLGEGVPEPTLDEWTRFVDAYLATSQARTNTCVVDSDPVADREELRYYCLAYLLSATFKDCSLVIRVGSRPGPETLDTAADGQEEHQDAHTCRKTTSEVKLIDLDVKSIKRLAKWEKLDREIVTAYAQTRRTS